MAKFKDSDLRKLKHNSSLPKEITRINSGTLPWGAEHFTSPNFRQREFEVESFS